MAERIALVTGCSSGFGLGIATRLTASGWKVLATVRDPSNVAPQLANAEILALDLTDESGIIALAARIHDLDCLINNAGYALTGPFASYSAGQMCRQLQVNFLGAALLTQALLPALTRRRGRIINISSMLGETGMPMNSLYSASKHALEGWSQSLHYELAAQAVQVALVEPGGHRTRFADKMVWGERALHEDSIEARQATAYRAARQRLLAGPGNSPSAVVDAVLRLTTLERMPLRTRVGRDAKLLRALRHWLPERWSDALLGAAVRRQFGTEHT